MNGWEAIHPALEERTHVNPVAEELRPSAGSLQEGPLSALFPSPGAFHPRPLQCSTRMGPSPGGRTIPTALAGIRKH